MSNNKELFEAIKKTDEVYIDDELVRNKWSSENTNGDSVFDVLRRCDFYLFTFENNVLRIRTK